MGVKINVQHNTKYKRGKIAKGAKKSKTLCRLISCDVPNRYTAKTIFLFAFVCVIEKEHFDKTGTRFVWEALKINSTSVTRKITMMQVEPSSWCRRSWFKVKEVVVGRGGGTLVYIPETFQAPEVGVYIGGFFSTGTLWFAVEFSCGRLSFVRNHQCVDDEQFKASVYSCATGWIKKMEGDREDKILMMS